MDKTMARTGVVLLEFDPGRNAIAPDKQLADGLSMVVQVGNSLWLANDETVGIECLSLHPGPGPGTWAARDHGQLSLADHLPLPPEPSPGKVEEIDLEGGDCDGRSLWLVGSHSRKRRKAKGQDKAKDRKRLACVESESNRYFLARIPLAPGGEPPVAALAAGFPPAARLGGDARGNDLTAALAGDEHLGPFLTIPGKDNGFDIEGLAVAAPRLFLGLRGPVLRGWAVILEVEPADQPASPGILGLSPLGPDGRPYRKHFLDLEGLGVRDLCRRGDDLLILAGPTMDLDGPVAVFRWPGGARAPGEQLVPAGDLEKLFHLPHGHGDDHAEGMTLFSPDGGEASSLLVVYDAAAPCRRLNGHTLTADIFPLP